MRGLDASDKRHTLTIMAREPRSERLALRMAPTEYAMLERLSEIDGLTLSDALRLAIRSAYRERFGTTPPKASRPKGAK